MASFWRQNRGMRRVAVLVVAATLTLATVSRAQEGQSSPAAQPPPIDAARLGISLDRIRKELSEPRETMSIDGQRLSVRIDVFGLAPPLMLIPDDFSLTYGPVPGSAPTHREHIEFVTPLQFRSPTVPIYGLAVWAAQKLAEKNKKAQCEEEIANYRALVVQGVAVAAPRCSQ